MFSPHTIDMIFSKKALEVPWEQKGTQNQKNGSGTICAILNFWNIKETCFEFLLVYFNNIFSSNNN